MLLSEVALGEMYELKKAKVGFITKLMFLVHAYEFVCQS